MTALGMSCYSLEAMLRLQQKFDPKWFIPERTYLHAYHVQQKNFYPDIGFEASVFMGKINYTQELNSIVRTLDRIENGTHLVHDVNSWTAPFQEFVSVHYSKGMIQNIGRKFKIKFKFLCVLFQTCTRSN